MKRYGEKLGRKENCVDNENKEKLDMIYLLREGGNTLDGPGRICGRKKGERWKKNLDTE